MLRKTVVGLRVSKVEQSNVRGILICIAVVTNFRAVNEQLF